MTAYGQRNERQQHYVELAPLASDAPVGQRFSGRLNRSCESVGRACGPAQSDFEAYPAECLAASRCAYVRECMRVFVRASAILRARSALG